MSIIIAFATLAELLGFLAYDFIRNRGNGSGRLLIRLSAGVCGSVLVLMEILLQPDSCLDGVIMDLMVLSEILLAYPCSFEKAAVSIKVVLSICAVMLMSSMGFILVPSGYSLFRTQRLVWTVLMVIVSFSVYFSFVAFRRLHEIRLLFRNAAVWHGVEDYARFLYSLVFLSLTLFFMCASIVPGDGGLALKVSSSVLFMAIYAVLYLRDMTGKTYILSFSTENRIKDIIKGNLRTSYVDKAEDDKKMNNLYRKIMFLMAEKKPYLDASFSMNDLASQVYSNKLYLSRTINMLSGRNFRQFLNYHRVQYAMALFKKDPSLKVSEAAEMSGFHSPVSFNMAFKVNTGKTPSEWVQDNIYDLRERL